MPRRACGALAVSISCTPAARKQPWPRPPASMLHRSRWPTARPIVRRWVRAGGVLHNRETPRHPAGGNGSGGETEAESALERDEREAFDRELSRQLGGDRTPVDPPVGLPLATGEQTRPRQSAAVSPGPAPPSNGVSGSSPHGEALATPLLPGRGWSRSARRDKDALRMANEASGRGRLAFDSVVAEDAGFGNAEAGDSGGARADEVLLSILRAHADTPLASSPQPLLTPTPHNPAVSDDESVPWPPQQPLAADYQPKPAQPLPRRRQAQRLKLQRPET